VSNKQKETVRNGKLRTNSWGKVPYISIPPISLYARRYGRYWSATGMLLFPLE